MLKRLGESILGTLSFVFVFIAGLILAVLSFLWYFVPKKEREWRAAEDAEAAKRVTEIKKTIAAAHEERAVETQAKVTEIEKKAEDQKTRDSVDIANELLKG